MTNHNSSAAAPPGPVDKIDLQLDPASFPRIQALLQDYPDICRISALSRKSDSYLLNHPDLIKRVLIDNHKNYNKGIGYERAKLLLGNGIIVSDGDFWKQQRRMVQPAFHRDMLKSLTSTIQTVSRKLLLQWKQLAEKEQSFDLNRATSEFGLEVMLRCLFSDDLDVMIDESGGNNPFAIFTDEHERDLTLAVKFRALTRLIQKTIQRRREENMQPPDMLGALMTATDLQGKPMPDKALIDELMTLIVAGHETSAITLSWMWYLLSQNPDVENRLLQEVDALDHLSPEFADQEKLGYCKQVMYETLRLYPPVWLFSRRALEDDAVGAYRIPAGSDLFISPYFLHRREDLWPDCERFDPERFAAAETQKHHRTSFIPFSAGPRKCIGDVLSILEVQIHMGTIARQLVLRYVPDRPIELEPAINLRSRYSIKMIPQLRQ